MGWNDQLVEVVKIQEGQFSMALKCKWKEYSFKWIFIGVYGPLDAVVHTTM